MPVKKAKNEQMASTASSRGKKKAVVSRGRTKNKATRVSLVKNKTTSRGTVKQKSKQSKSANKRRLSIKRSAVEKNKLKKKNTQTKKKAATVRKSKVDSARSRQKKRNIADQNLLIFQGDNLEVIPAKSIEPLAHSSLGERFISSTVERSHTNHLSSSAEGVRVSVDWQAQVSPHLVDLKGGEVNNLRKKVEKSNNKVTFEERLARWEEKLRSVKTNFITPEVRKLASEGNDLQSDVKVGRIKRFLYISWEKISLFFSRQGEKFIQSLLYRSLSPPSTVEGGEACLPSEVEITGKDNWWQRQSVVVSVSLFVILAMLLTVPIKAFTVYEQLQMQKSQVLGVSTSVFAEVEEAIGSLQQLDFNQAGDSFSAAANDLMTIAKLFDNYPPLLISLAEVVSDQGKYLESAQPLIAAAHELAVAGAGLSEILANIGNSSTINLIDKLKFLLGGLNDFNNNLRKSLADLNKVDLKKVPTDYQQSLGLLNKFLPSLISSVDQISTMLSLGVKLLGEEEPQRYLVVFQNSNELRPTGGFMGTVAEVDLKTGEITELNVPPGGVYDFQGSLKVLLAAPKPLRMMNANWQLQDANWFFDFPTSAKKVLWFYEKSGGPTRDGLIAINSTLLPQLLEIIGPVSLANRGVELTADNVIDLLQQEVEFGDDKKENKPKQIIAELTPLIVNKLENLEKDKFLPVLSLFLQALEKRDIQIYHRKDQLENQIKQLGWGGEVKQTEQDYLAVVNTNIKGGKTDNFIKQRFYLQTEIDAAGNIINHLRIVKTHTGDPDSVFGGDVNLDYLRVYVPAGSELLEAKGFYRPFDDEFSDPAPGYSEDDFLAAVERNPIVHEQSGTRITDEFGKTVFGNWVKVEPGQTVEVSLTYRLPFKIEFKDTASENLLVNYFDRLLRFLGIDISQSSPLALYTILWQKQAGQNPPLLEHSLILPAGWQFATVEKLQNKIAQGENSIVLTQELKQDFFWGGILLRP